MATPRRRYPDELKRRKEMRQKFRTLVRSVMFNRIWLADAEEQKMSLNVKKNIAMLVRTHEKIGTLTVAEKSIIRTLHNFRSIEDRKKLVTLFAGLACFQTLPPKVRARLVPVMKFQLVKSGRTLIREGDEPHMISFILSGEVEVTKKVYDHVTKEYVEKLQFILGPGDYLGDIALLENTLRKRTYMPRADTELLVIYDEEDFDRILRPVMSAQWECKKAAIRCLDYFNCFTDEQIIYACKLGHVKQFDSLETIYHEDKGAVTFVHFIISGECMILQCLKMRTKIKNKGKKSFELVEVGKEDVDAMFKNKTKQELLEMLLKETHSENLLPEKTQSQYSRQAHKSAKSMQSESEQILKNIEIRCGLRRKPSYRKHRAYRKYSKKDDVMEEEFDEEEEEESDLEDLEEIEDEYEYGTLEETFIETIKSNNQEKINKTKRNERKISLKAKFKSRGEENEENEEEEFEMFSSTSSSSGASLLSEPSNQETPVKIENHFIDVGSLTFGGIFGLGEQLEHRVIMARTTVQCLMLPRFWLMEKEQNPGNIWQRRRFYLDCTIPSRQSLFNDFITTRKWQAFKTKLIQSNLEHIVGNPTKIQDVPIICRIVEASDD